MIWWILFLQKLWKIMIETGVSDYRIDKKNVTIYISVSFREVIRNSVCCLSTREFYNLFRLSILFSILKVRQTKEYGCAVSIFLSIKIIYTFFSQKYALIYRDRIRSLVYLRRKWRIAHSSVTYEKHMNVDYKVFFYFKMK